MKRKIISIVWMTIGLTMVSIAADGFGSPLEGRFWLSILGTLIIMIVAYVAGIMDGLNME